MTATAVELTGPQIFAGLPLEGPKDLMVRYHGFRIAADHLCRLAFGGVCEA